MKLYFVRHGETDFQALEARGVKGWARSFAPLTAIGRVQIDVIANDYRLQEADAILCSSYARALESAARLSRILNKPLYVEYDLHEWLPQKDPLADLDEASLSLAMNEFAFYTGYNASFDGLSEAAPAARSARPHTLPPPEARTWESLDEVRDRVLRALGRYKHLKKVVVVSHAVVIASIIGVQRQIQHAEIVPFDLDFDAGNAVEESVRQGS